MYDLTVAFVAQGVGTHGAEGSRDRWAIRSSLFVVTGHVILMQDRICVLKEDL